MSQHKIRAALVKAFIDADFGLSIAHENRHFEPEQGSPWVRFSFAPNPPEVSTIGQVGLDKHSGLVFVDIFYPTGEGTGRAATKAEEIRAYFPAGKRFSFSGQNVQIVNSGRLQGRIEKDWFQIPVSISWTAETQRTGV